MKPTFLFVLILVGCGLVLPCVAAQQNSDTPNLATPQEKHLRNVRQLTFGGQNAEAYFSGDGQKLIFQSTRDNLQCDQIFTMNVDGSNVQMVSNGKGRTTCGYFYPNGKTILYSSTYLTDTQCPPRPDYLQGIHVGGVSGVRYLCRQSRWLRPHATHQHAGLRRRGHDLGRWQEHRLHFHAQRRSRHLHHGRRRQARETTHSRTGIRWRPGLFAGRKADCLSRLSPLRRKRNGRI